MIKRLLFLALALVALAAPAQAQLGTVPNTFIEGVNIIDDLNENFTTAYSTALNRTGGTMTGQLTSQAIVPATTATYDLGSVLVKFRDAFFSRNVDIAGTLNLDGALSDSNSAVQVNDQFQITSTTVAQFQSRYDSSNYWEASTSSAGAITINAVGASQGFTFSDNVIVSGTVTATSFASPTASDSLLVSGLSPSIRMFETNASADAKNWRLIADADVITLQTLADNLSAGNPVFAVGRTGTTVGTFFLYTALNASGSFTAGGQILADDGTTSAPGLSFTGDTNSGFIGGGVDGQVVFVVNGDSLWQVTNIASTPLMSIFADLTVSRTVKLTGTTFAGLGTPANGTFTYCSDCTVASPCASGGTGAIAKRLNSTWVCN